MSSIVSGTIASCGINEIYLYNKNIDDYRDLLVHPIQKHKEDINRVTFYRRLKQLFITYHTLVHDNLKKCQSYIISYDINVGDNLGPLYANDILFYKYENDYFACT